MSELIEQILDLLEIVKARQKTDPTIPTEKHRRDAEKQVAKQRAVYDTTVSNKYRRGLNPPIANTGDFDRFVDLWVRKGSPELQRILLQHSKTDAEEERVRQFFSATQSEHTRVATVKVRTGQTVLSGEAELSCPVAEDIEEPSGPHRIAQKTYRILRDTALSQEIKEDQQHTCQFCDEPFMLSDDIPYAEAHHVKPLGKPHDGPDIRRNILCVCPNHHAQLDYGAIRLDSSKLKDISAEYIKYHNTRIYGKRSGRRTLSSRSRHQGRK